MYFPYRLAKHLDRLSICLPQGLTIPVDPVAALAFAVEADRAADISLAEGRFDAAERLSHAALEARARAAGRRA